LAVESKYGGKEEGVIFKALDDSFIIKMQQSYQTDQAERTKIKMKYREDDIDKENKYWDNVRLVALNIIKKVQRGKEIKYVNFPTFLKDCADELKKETLQFKHSKKNTTQVKDDIMGNIKIIGRKSLKGNNNFLFLGKFRVLTQAHYNIIKKGLKKYDGGVICIVTSKDTKATKDLRTKMVQKAFPNIEIVHHNSGNLFSIMNKASKNVNVVLAGTDRYSAYKSLLSRNPDISVEETKRSEQDISASKVIENINDENYFKKNTPKEIHGMYKEILKTYGKSI